MEKNYVKYGNSCGTNGCGGGGSESSKQITGCRFSISEMSDNYIELILGAIKKVDTSKVWSKTDKLSTLYRGKAVHVEDAVKACFVNAYYENVHMTMECTFSKGCPGDVEADSFMAEDDVLMNEPKIKDIHFPVTCKISLYPMGISDYMKHIAEIVNHSIDLGIYAGSTHYCTLIECDVQDLFSYISYVNDYCGKNIKHYVFEVTMSVNSPTK